MYSCTLLLLLQSFCGGVQAFHQELVLLRRSSVTRISRHHSQVVLHQAAQVADGNIRDDIDDVDEWCCLLSGSEFKTHAGECINPYKVLGISHEQATRREIKQAYFSASRRYHPDARLATAADKTVGAADDSDEDASERWERIRLSYEILSNSKLM